MQYSRDYGWFRQPWTNAITIFLLMCICFRPRRLCVRHPRWRWQCIAGHCYYQLSLLSSFFFMKKGDFRAFFLRSVTAAWATPSPWSIPPIFFHQAVGLRMRDLFKISSHFYWNRYICFLWITGIVNQAHWSLKYCHTWPRGETHRVGCRGHCYLTSQPPHTRPARQPVNSHQLHS